MCNSLLHLHLIDMEPYVLLGSLLAIRVFDTTYAHSKFRSHGVVNVCFTNYY